MVSEPSSHQRSKGGQQASRRVKEKEATETSVALGCEGFQGHEGMRAGNPREFWHTVPILFSIPHRPTKLLIEPAACKSLKIPEVASRALASLLTTERGICGNRAGNRAAAEATRATALRFSLGEQAKKIPTDKGWDFEYWWPTGKLKPSALFCI